MNEDRQPELFPPETFSQEQQPQITASASIQAAMGAFDRFLDENGKTENTRRAFASDVHLLGKYLGVGQPIGEIGTKNLNDFLNWLVYERGIPCSRKSYARRVTTLKAFFGWLQESGVISSNPASAVIQISVSSPLPQLPSEEDLAAALAVSSELRAGTDEEDPDARPHLLLTLLLTTGIKKSETVRLVPNHIDRLNPEAPYVFIRYSNPEHRHKERKIPLDVSWLSTLDEYLQQYEPGDTLFNCTARNLEYILSNVGELAGLSQGQLSFENLRWVSALRALDSGMDPNQIRQNLGLMPVTWRETRSKLEKLRERKP